MESKAAFKRNFLILKQEDVGYADMREPSGFIKIEIKDGKGRLFASVKNLRENKVGSNYIVYMLSCTPKQVCSVCTGSIALTKSQGELEWYFDPENVSSTGKRIGEFNIFAVISIQRDKQEDAFICPLVAYRGKEVVWRDRVKGALHSLRTSENEYGIYERNQKEFYKGIVEDNAGINSNKTFRKEESGKYNFRDSEGIDKKDSRNEIPRSESGSDNITGCIYNNGLNYSQEEQYAGYNPCANCFAANFKDVKYTNGEVPVSSKTDTNPSNTYEENLEQLGKVFDRCFEPNDPFGSNRKDYRWWKVASPISLNNVLYQCNIRTTPLLFNPVVMMSHFKYRYIIIGIYCDKQKEKEYIVCGIPGVNGIDERPFGDMCRWVQLEGSKLNYGTFGYWIAYIDPRTGNFQSLS